MNDFLEIEPKTKIGNVIWIYHLTAEDITRSDLSNIRLFYLKQSKVQAQYEPDQAIAICRWSTLTKAVALGRDRNDSLGSSTSCYPAVAGERTICATRSLMRAMAFLTPEGDRPTPTTFAIFAADISSK